MQKLSKFLMLSARSAVLVFERDLDEVPRIEFSGADAPALFSANYASSALTASKMSYYVSHGYAHFTLNEDNFPGICKAGGADYFLCGNFNGWGEAIGSSEWKLTRYPDSSEWKLAVPMDRFEDRKKKYLFKFADNSGRWLEPRPDAVNIEYDSKGNSNLRFFPQRTGRHIIVALFARDLDLRCDVRARAPEAAPEELPIDTSFLLYKLGAGEALGARVEGGKTRFALFAPRAIGVSLTWFKDAHSPRGVMEMHRSSTTTWTAEVPEDLHGFLYGYNVRGDNPDAFTAFDESALVADPFARAMPASDGAGFVVDLARLPRPKRRFTPPNWHDLVIMEAHLRDLLAHAPAELGADERLGFRGLAKWLRDPSCYLRTCGVNCVELQPVSEFMHESREEYQWGYMPVNWFAPASSYASSPEKMSQLEEFAELVEAFHDANLAVVLDVVYNHTGSPNGLLRMDKQYFFETDGAGNLMNYSGCGNDFRPNTPVGRELIIESLKFLVETFDVDGFRFDLAELVGVKALSDVELELKKIKPSIILIAEPWSFRGHIAKTLKQTGFTSWNDGFREFARGYASGGGDTGALKYFLSGSAGGVAAWPGQTVNYVESHDDMCFFDRVAANYLDPSGPEIRRYKFGYALTLLALGIPMVAEGFDFMRTKFGKNNTHLDGAANALDYSRALRFPGVCEWLRGLVKFRLSEDGAALRRPHPVSSGFFRFFGAENSGALCAVFNADKSEPTRRVMAAFNPAGDAASFGFGDFDASGFTQVADIDRVSPGGLGCALCEIKNGALALPPASLGVWVEK